MKLSLTRKRSLFDSGLAHEHETAPDLDNAVRGCAVSVLWDRASFGGLLRPGPASVDRLGEGSERLVGGSTEACELVEVGVSTRKVEALVHQACCALGNTPRKLSDRSSVR